MKLNGIVKIAAALIVISCTTNDMGANYVSQVSSNSYDTSYFTDLIEENHYLRAYNYYHSVYPLQKAEGEWGELYQEMLRGVISSFNEAKENQDYDKAFAIYNSLVATGENNQLGLTRTELDYHYLESLIERGFTAAVGSHFLHMERTELSINQLSVLEDFFIENQLISPLRVLQETLRQKGSPIASEGSKLLEREVKKVDMLSGTVTIWVDRGIRLEKGIGYPDRIIGSGFFIDPNGYILTNYHVISSEVDPTYEGYSKLYIKINENENERIPATVVGWDPVLDLALLKTEISSPYAFSFSHDENYALGESIFAIGSPGGLTNTVTSGTISNLGRKLQDMGESLQIDVPINPGNSGGPLLNQLGEIIGVVYAGIETYEGINFAIPAAYVKDILPRLYQGGRIEYPWMGSVVYEDFGKIVNAYTIPGTSSELSQLSGGDIIKKINGVPLTDITQIQNILIQSFPEELMNLTIERGSEELVLPIALTERPDTPMEVLLSRDSIDNLFTPIFGMETTRINQNKNIRQYRIEGVYPGSIGDESGLNSGDSFSLRKWTNREEDQVLLIQMVIKARKSGFIESGLQLGAYYHSNSFI